MWEYPKEKETGGNNFILQKKLNIFLLYSKYKLNIFLLYSRYKLNICLLYSYRLPDQKTWFTFLDARNAKYSM